LEGNGLIGAEHGAKSASQASLLDDRQVAVFTTYDFNGALFDAKSTLYAQCVIDGRLPSDGTEAPLDVLLICRSVELEGAATAGAAKAHLKPVGHVFLSFYTQQKPFDFNPESLADQTQFSTFVNMGQGLLHAGFMPHALLDYRTRSSTDKEAAVIMGIFLAVVGGTTKTFIHYCPVLGLVDRLLHHVNGQGDPLG